MITTLLNIIDLFIDFVTLGQYGLDGARTWED